MSAKTSMTENGQGSSRQVVAACTSMGTPVTRPNNVGCNSQGSSKAQNGEQKKKGGVEVETEENLRLEGVQASLPQIKEMLAEMLAKVEVSLKTDTVCIAAVRADIGQVLGRVEEIEERMDKYDQRLEEMNEQIKSLQKTNRLLFYKMEDQEN